MIPSRAQFPGPIFTQVLTGLSADRACRTGPRCLTRRLGTQWLDPVSPESSARRCSECTTWRACSSHRSGQEQGDRRTVQYCGRIRSGWQNGPCNCAEHFSSFRRLQLGHAHGRTELRCGATRGRHSPPSRGAGGCPSICAKRRALARCPPDGLSGAYRQLSSEVCERLVRSLQHEYGWCVTV